MLKKIFAVGFLAALAIFIVPTAANAAPYGDAGAGAGTVVVTAGQPGTLTFCGFQPGELTTASAPEAVTIETNDRTAGADGCVTYTASATRAGSYTITVTSASIVSVGVLTITPVDSDAGAGSSAGGSNAGGSNAVGSNDGGSSDGGSSAGGTLPSTGLEIPMLVVWGASGALVLGVALVLVLTFVRRSANAS